MLAEPECESNLSDLQDQLRRAERVTPDLMSRIVVDAFTHVAMPARIDRLIESEAWTEAALALVELELPQWRLHRLVYEEDSWRCSLSQQWNRRVRLTDCAQSRHESLPLAILGALIEARQCGEPPASSVPRCGIGSGFSAKIMCCDNFS